MPRSPIAPAAIALALAAGTGHAGPGDLHRITADLVNLRAGPSEAATVRDRIEGGTEVVELRADGGWIGVRVVETGQEGWIYGDLLDRVARSELGATPGEHGFRAFSRDFDRLVGEIVGLTGIAMVEGVAEEGDRLTVTPTPAWLRASSREAQLLAAASIYQMWKNYRNQAPVAVAIGDGRGGDYIVIEDAGETGPRIRVTDRARGSGGRG